MGWGALLPIAAAATSAVADYVGGQKSIEAQKEFNASQERLGYANMQMQKEFAQNGIQWKVADAAKAGISPLAALGNQGISYSPVSIGGQAPVDSRFQGFSRMGQDLTRAFLATRPQEEREARMLAALRMENVKSDTEKNKAQAAYWASMAAKNSGSQIGPGMSLRPNEAADFQWFVDEDGRMYRGPSQEWSQAYQNVPFAGTARAIQPMLRMDSWRSIAQMPYNFYRYWRGSHRAAEDRGR